ncbi:MAG: penicillin-binding protein 1C [Planctomycetota bacterium]
MARERETKDGARRVSRWRRWRRGLFVAAAAASVVGTISLSFLWLALPFPFGELDSFPAGARVLDRNGELLRVYRSSADEMRFPVSLERVNPWVSKATIAVEDKRFYSHVGVDPVAISRALVQNIARGRVHSGASTLTMQLARIVGGRKRTWSAKLTEAVHALQITAARSKNQTLEDYLNLAPYGGNLRGIEAAARRYLGKSAEFLTLGEASMLAGLPQSPSRLRPDRYYDRALRRREEVLDAMLRVGIISQNEHREAFASRPIVRRHPWPLRAPQFSDAVRYRLTKRGATGGPTLRTTLDLDMHRDANRILSRWFHGPRRDARAKLNGAALVVHVPSATIRAYVASVDFASKERRGQVNWIARRRSPGSALKPFLYAEAFDRGLAGPSTYLADVARSFAGYVPENASGEYEGPVPAGEALARSLNLPAIELQRRLGTSEFFSVLRELELPPPDARSDAFGVTLCLGSLETRLLDLADAYAALARGGQWRRSTAVELKSDDLRARASKRVFSSAASHLVLTALSSSSHLERAVGRTPKERTSVAYKTGTSSGRRDATCVAVSREFVVAVRLGSPEGDPHRDLVGIESAAPIALEILEAVDPDPKPWLKPESLVYETVCGQTGYPANEHCPHRRRAAFARPGTTVGACQVHRRVDVDRARRVAVCRSCAKGHTGSAVVEVWPSAVSAWLREHGGLAVSYPHDPNCSRVVRAQRRPRILTPSDGSQLRWVENAPFRQEILLSAAAANGIDRLHWFVDGELLGCTRTKSSLAWTVRPGRHTFLCVDDLGRSSRVQIDVR